MAKTVQVRCNLPNGLALRNFEFVPTEAGGKIAQPVGEPFILHEGLNDVPADFANTFFKMHADADYVQSGAIRLEDETKRSGTAGKAGNDVSGTQQSPA